MNKLRTLFYAGLVLGSFSCSTANTEQPKISLAPYPNSLIKQEGIFQLNDNITLSASNDSMHTIAQMFKEQVKKSTGIDLKFSQNAKTYQHIQFKLNKAIANKEGYELKITPKIVTVSASTKAGLLYGMETLLQLFPSDIYSSAPQHNVNWIAPCVTIKDAPTFPWRGMMLDVSRHFFTADEVKRHIKSLAEHKINVFHWGLINDQGWRIEIKKYPLLTERSAWRVDHEDMAWNNRPAQKEGEKATYGGFYTQKQIKEVIAYAKNLNVEIVPEIEMPAHVSCLFASYPELSCKQEQITTPPGGLWPITDIYCAGNEDVYHFIDDVMTEVAALFPSKYIHIGGDEADHSEWEKCPKCQKVMRREHLKNEDELQSYFVKRVEKIVNSKGKSIIGWDEILKGGLAPNSTVMSWRGIKGGIQAAQEGHDVIMTPTSHCYFDYYQGPMDLEPTAFNAQLPLSTVYQFNPIPKELNAEEGKHVLGGQANLWTEHVPVFSHLQYMTYPRLAAMSEALWTQSSNKNWNRFKTTLPTLFARYTAEGINYAESCYAVKASSHYDAKTKKTTVKLTTEIQGGTIYYTINGEDPSELTTPYNGPFTIDKTTTVKAVQIVRGEKMGKVNSIPFYLHKASQAKVTQKVAPHKAYQGQGISTLVNCTIGTLDFHDGQWLGWLGQDMETILDLGKEIDIHSIKSNHLQSSGSKILLPSLVEYFASVDGKEWISIGKIPNTKGIHSPDGTFNYPMELTEPLNSRYIKVHAYQSNDKDKANNWIFADEIIIE